ncbi:MAG: ferritin family protein [Fibrobacterota bacterium]
MTAREQALQELIDAEYSAARNYRRFSQQAAREKYPKTAQLFAALSAAEEVHCANHLRALKKTYSPHFTEDPLQTTRENIRRTLSAEKEETRRIYPAHLKALRKKGDSRPVKTARLSMEWARLAEKQHSKHLKKALKALEKGRDAAFGTIWYCRACGNIECDSRAQKPCTVCGHDALFFTQIEKGVSE